MVEDWIVLWPRGVEDCVEMEFFSKPREEVSVIGLVIGLDVGESRCSFDRIFFRKPSVGIEKDLWRGCTLMSLVSRLRSTDSRRTAG